MHFTKKGGAPVTYVAADDPADAAAVRDVDLQRKYHLPAKELAEKLHLTPNRATALRRHLSIDQDPSCRQEFVFGAARHVAFSDNAYRKMKAALDMDAVWAEHGWAAASQSTD